MACVLITRSLFDCAIEYVQRYASKDTSEDSDKDNDDDDEMSSVGSYESGEDDEAPGNMDDI